MGFGVETEKGLCHFERPREGIVSKSAHLALAVAAHAMRINREDFAGIVTSRSAQQAEVDLQSFGLGHGMSLQQVVDRPITGHERKAIEQLESSLTQMAGIADPGHAQGGFVDHLQS
jgi:hypothetical protein